MNKSIVNNLKKSKTIVDFFELHEDSAICFCYNPGDESQEAYTEILIPLSDFEKWLNNEGDYLKGSDQELTHPDDPCSGAKWEWDFTIEEFMDATNHNHDLCGLLTNFLNKK